MFQLIIFEIKSLRNPKKIPWEEVKALKYPYGEPHQVGVIKSQADDFRVSENLGFEACGEGEHLFLHIEKTNLTTPDLIEQVAREFSVKARDIGYSGLKDKIAVTQQWLSVHLPGQMNSVEIPSSSHYTLLQHGWHNKKIRSGSHRSNSFEVIVRGVAELSNQTQQQIDDVKISGMANYFGEQRFGAQQDNVERAIHTFTNERRTRKLSRTKRSLYISSLRSFLFNQILSQRLEQNHWHQPLQGDVYMLSGSHSLFSDAIDDSILERYQQQDISSAASLFGDGISMLSENALAIENAVYQQYPKIVECLVAQKVKLQMRTTRATVEGFNVAHDFDSQSLKVTATLPSGCFFTTLLKHFIDTSNTV
ncbi:MAG: tRNA pseudouridine13 synthase [Gammaproteobacteria bacterium]|jgi:tRNA pseudouridine13 synthase